MNSIWRRHRRLFKPQNKNYLINLNNLVLKPFHNFSLPNSKDFSSIFQLVFKNTWNKHKEYRKNVCPYSGPNYELRPCWARNYFQQENEKYNCHTKHQSNIRQSTVSLWILYILGQKVGERGASWPGGRLPLFLLKIQF